MRSIDLPMTTEPVFAFGGATLHAQTWQMQRDNQRCPSKWGTTERIAILGGNAVKLMKIAA